MQRAIAYARVSTKRQADDGLRVANTVVVIAGIAETKFS